MKRKLYLFILIALIFGFSMASTLSVQSGSGIYPISFAPKTNANEITIFTPENKTYTKPMSGYYPATYGFENDLVGNDPYGWTVFEPGPQNVEIISNLDGHNNVLALFDTESGTGDWAFANNNFAPQISGTVEFWYRTGGFLEDQTFHLQSSSDISIYFAVVSGNFMYRNASGFQVLAPHNNDQWYHIRFDFDCTSDTYDFYLDGNLIKSNLEFYITASSLEKIIFFTRQWGTSSDYYTYVDALGYSWDPNYNIGDSLNEGLLLSYENATNLDWKGYSFDGQTNKTILGNTTIAMPDFGLHTIQMFGNDSFGTTFQSAIRHFSISPINIITPENRTYTQPMSGYYPGTYGFENEEDNELGTEVAFISRYESDHSEAYARIEDNIYGRNKVLKFYDAATTNSYNFYAYHDFPTKIPYGTIEFWVLNTEYSGDRLGIYYHFSNSSGADYVSVDTFNSLFYLIIDGDNDGLIKIQTGNGESTWSGLYSDNIWHHIRVDFESSLGGYLGLEQYKLNFWFDGLELLNNEPLIINDSLGVIASHSHGWDDTRHDYLDAVGFSWDPDYIVGDNLDEGLLLSYDNSTPLDWQGYSYDGQVNKTILGNTTIPMPSYGSHTIQVFGNNSLGTIYESSVRYFSISPIDLITPENKTYTEPDSGYYPATYGFEDVKDGAFSTEWIDSSSASCTAKIIGSLGGHRKVYELYDNNPGGYAWIIQNWSIPREKGTIELYVRATDASVGNFVQLRNDTSPVNPLAINFGIYQNKFQYNDGAWKDVGCGALPDTWYHIRFDWETTNGGYQGLSQWKWKIEIDGIPFGSFNFENDIVPEMFSTNTRAPLTGFYWYIDDVAYSWDPNYNIGDNLYEGLLLSFENRTNLDWIGYSLDGQNNKTILGQTTIPLLNNGLHSLVLNANDTSGTDFSSNLKYFSVLTSGPSVSATSPLPSQYFGISAPSYNVNIQGVNLAKFWYSLDNGVTNITFSSYSGGISQTEWDKCPHGTVQIDFYVNDSFGRMGHDTIVIFKDLNAPTTSLEYTAFNPPNQVNITTQFTLTATDDGSGVSTIEYKINDGLWTTYTGTFTLSGYNLGLYTITYRSGDLVGNIESEQLLNIELVIPPLEPPDPPDLSFLLYIIIIGAVITTIGFLYFKVVRPRTAESRELKKKNRLEQRKLKQERKEKIAIEREKLERERLEQVRIERKAEIQMQVSPSAMESVDTRREKISKFKYCPECGNPLKPEDLSFCSNCGTKVKHVKPSINTSEFIDGIIISLIGGSISILLGFAVPFIYPEVANSMGALFLILQLAMIIGGIVSIIGAIVVFFKPRLGSSIIATGGILAGMNIITVAGAGRILKKLRETGVIPQKKKRTPKGISGELFCPFCHSEVKSGQVSCDYCGNRLDT